MNEIAEIETLVAREIARVIELIGREFDLPPKTASILSELRAARMKCKKLAFTNENHLGWYTFGQENGGISIDNILPLLISELSEIHEEPMGILSALVIGYRDEPALMKGYIKGMYPLFVSAPTGNIVEHGMKRPPELHLHWDSTVTHSTPALVRAADLIGQLSDPRYLQKISALFYEFEETGQNKKLGYNNPGDLRQGYPKFYWNVVYSYVKDAIAYLNLTQQGKQILANLSANVFRVEHDDTVPEAVFVN